MSAPLVVHSVIFKNNPAKWSDPFEIDVVFEAREDLDKCKSSSDYYIILTKLCYFSNGLSICIRWFWR